MRRVFYLFRVAIISPEFVSLAIIALLLYIQPSIFIWLSSKIDTTNEMVKWFSLLPAGITGILVSRNSELLSPGSQELSAILLKWPDYYKIEYRYWICLFFSILGAISCGSVSLFGDLKNHIMLAIFLAGIIIASITFLTFLSATITLKRIISTMM
jgi:hypothetical protein